MYIELIESEFQIGSPIKIELKDRTVVGEVSKISSPVVIVKRTDGGREFINDSEIIGISEPSKMDTIVRRFKIGDLVIVNKGAIAQVGKIIDINNTDQILTIENKLSKKFSYFANEISGIDYYTFFEKKKKILNDPTINKAKESQVEKEVHKNTTDESLSVIKHNPKVIKPIAIPKIRMIIDKIIKDGDNARAIEEIDKALNSYTDLEPKLINSLLLSKAQAFTALSDYVNARETYIALIKFNQGNKNLYSDRALSHLYSVLARFQAQTEQKENAIISLETALKFNPDNSMASTLMEQIKSDTVPMPFSPNIEDKQFEIISGDETFDYTISEMLDIDIKEHDFSDDRIIDNGGKVNKIIAKQIFEDAKKTKKEENYTKQEDLSNRFSKYLEAAKAYSELPSGSYDIQEYIESAAYYAIFKGNYLYFQFIDSITQGNYDRFNLIQLKDSACSYYVESLNLLSNINKVHLLNVLSNYIKLNIALYKLNNNLNEVIPTGQFGKVFRECLNGTNDLRKIAWETVVTIGSASPSAWTNLVRIKGGTGGLYGFMDNEIDRLNVYNIVNNNEQTNIDTSLKPGEFLKEAFKIRRKINNDFNILILSLRKHKLDFHLFDSLKTEWQKIDSYIKLLNTTDLESKKIGDKVLGILTPYLNRKDNERQNLLIQSQQILDKQIQFIEDNTTKYGRTLFYPLFRKWRETIAELLAEKISQTLPIFQIVADPPYIVSSSDGIKYVNLIIKNIGSGTAEGYIMIVRAKSNDIENTATHKNNSDIPAGEQVYKQMNLPENMYNCANIDFDVNIKAIYQGKEIQGENISFSVEVEPKSLLSIKDIQWQESKIPTSQFFKGREDILKKLTEHYISEERSKSFILYGLTRTGKSSILNYLGKQLNGQTINTEQGKFKIITFEWDFSKAATYKENDIWEYFLVIKLFNDLKKYFTDSTYKEELNVNNLNRAIEFENVLRYLSAKKLYPIFLVDEFTYIKEMIDKNLVTAAFLHSLRQIAIEGLASFVYAGTYDIKILLEDPTYGKTGQLANSIDEPIFAIDSQSAEDLINVIDDELHFSNEAIAHIHKLSGDVPFFIQIICKNCGYFAVENKRKYIGYPDLENVIKILTGEVEGSKSSRVKIIPENTFKDNFYNPKDKKEINALISSISFINKDNTTTPRGVSIIELSNLWGEYGIKEFKPLLVDAIKALKERQILIPCKDEGSTVYKITVDLFRRWWAVHHPDIDLELTSLQQ